MSLKFLKLGTLVRKEVNSFFNSLSAYGILLLYGIVLSVSFIHLGRFVLNDVASLRSYFAPMPYLFVVLIPILTMGVWSEEKKRSSIDLLYALPYSLKELVVGKFLGVFTVFLVMLLTSLPLIVMVLPMGEFDLGPVFTQFLGTILLGFMGLALGTFISSLSESQIVSFLLTFFVLLLFMFADAFVNIFGLGQSFLGFLLNFLSFNYHFDSFIKGVLDLRDVAFFVLGGSVFLYLTVSHLYFKKWQ